MSDIGLKISKPGIDVEDVNFLLDKRNFTVISTEQCIRIQEATVTPSGGNYNYTVSFLTDLTVPLTLTFQTDNIDNPTQWQIL
jgi:hypothetical protein